MHGLPLGFGVGAGSTVIVSRFVLIINKIIRRNNDTHPYSFHRVTSVLKIVTQLETASRAPNHSNIEDVARYKINLGLAFFDASEERIAAVTDRADAHWIVIDHSAIGIQAARAWTWILASLIDTRRIGTAVRANYAFRPARRRTADVVGLARAHCVIVNDTAIAVRSARRWLARVARHWRFCKRPIITESSNNNSKVLTESCRVEGLRDCSSTYRLVAGLERVAGVAGKAAAGRLMVVNLALRVNPTRAHARIFALVVDASLRVRAVRVLDAFRSATLVRIAGVIGQTGTRARAVTLFAHGVRAAR